MIVPHGSEQPRSLAVSERAVRWLRVGAIVLGTLFVALIGLAVSPYGVLGGRMAVKDDQRLGQELATLRLKMRGLQDTVSAIARRDEQLRLVAGLPSADSVAVATIDTPVGEPAPGSSSGLTPLGRLTAGTRADIDGLIRHANVLAASFAELSDTMTRNMDRLRNTPSIMPTAGWLTSHFTRSRLHPILHMSRPHEGIDVSAPMGAPIVAPASGTVTRVEVERGYGNVLEVTHGNGIVTKYAHCSRILVRPGQRVTRGQTIAMVGNTGLSTGPHLHYEIHVDGRVVDPLTYVMPDAIPD